MTIHIDPSAVTRTSIADRVRLIRSPGGIEAWLLEDHSIPSLSMSFGFRGGALLDPPGLAGATQTMVNLLTEGAGSLDSAGFARALGDRAIRLSFVARRDNIAGHLQTLTRNAEQAFELLRLSLCEPSFAPDAIARMRGAISAHVKQSLSDPGSVAARSFFARGFGDHGYGRPPEGDLTSIGAIDRDTIVAVHRLAITRSNLQIAVVGAIEPEALARALDHVFGMIPEGEAFRAPSLVLGAIGDRHTTRMSAPQSTIWFGRPGILRDDPDFIAAHVVNHCLGGGGFASRLMQEVRTKRGLCYGIWSEMSSDAAASTFMGSTSVPNARVGETLDVIAEEIRRLSREGLAADELANAKGYMIGVYGQNFDTSVSISSLFLALQFDRRDPSWLDERSQRILAVTAEDAARVAKRLFGDEAMLVTVAGDPEDCQDVQA